MKAKESPRKCFSGICRFVFGLIVVSFFSLAVCCFQSTLAQAAEDSTALYFSGIGVDQNLRTSLRLKNLEDRKLDLEAFFFDGEGTLLGTLPGLKTLKREELKTIGPRRIPSEVKGLRIQSNGSMEGVALLESKGRKRSEVIPLMRAGARQIDFPVLLGNDVAPKRLFLLNVGSSVATPMIYALDGGGIEIGSKALPAMVPMGSVEVSLAELFLEMAGSVVTARVLSDQELAGFQLIDAEGKDLVALPGLSEPGRDWIIPVAQSGKSVEL